MLKSPPSALRILTIDFLAFFGWISMLVAWGALVVIRLLNWQVRDFDYFLWFCAAVSVLGVALMAWRVMAIRRMFEEGQPEKGRVTHIFAYRDRALVGVEYTSAVGRKKVQARSNWLHNTGKVKKLQTGDEVTLLVNPAKPTSVLIEHLFRGQD